MRSMFRAKGILLIVNVMSFILSMEKHCTSSFCEIRFQCRLLSAVALNTYSIKLVKEPISIFKGGG